MIGKADLFCISIPVPSLNGMFGIIVLWSNFFQWCFI